MDSSDLNSVGESSGPQPHIPGSANPVNGNVQAWSGLRALCIPLVVGLAIALSSVYVAGDWRGVDVGFYRSYALGFWGALGHPLLPAEYPPLSILPFALTLAGPANWYPDVFAFWMGVLFVLGYFAFRRWAGPQQAGAYLVYSLAAGPATLVFRFDLVPALLVVGAVWLLQRKRFAAAYLFLAAGTLIKLYPLLIVPIAVVAHWRSRTDNRVGVRRKIVMGVGACLATITVGFVAAAIIDPRNGLSSLTYNFRRPNEVESVPATMLWLGSLLGIRATATASYGSFNLIGDLSGAVDALAAVALVAGLLWVYWRQLRGHLTTQQAAVAAVLVILCTSKVLSAQYVIWLAPLLAATVAFQLRWFFLCLTTALVFPTLFEVGVTYRGSSIAFSGVLLAGIAARNALLLLLTAHFLLAPGPEYSGHRDSLAAAASISLRGQDSAAEGRSV